MIGELRVLVVDDEELARRGLRVRLATMPRITVVAEVAAAADLHDAVVRHRPDVMLLDIDLAGVDAFATLRNLPTPMRPSVIFVTAHANRALEAFGVEAIDYLLKPVDDARLRASLERARTRGLGGHLPPRLLVRDGFHTHLVDVACIDWIQSAGDYVRVHAGPVSHLHQSSLSALEHELSPAGFCRIHREVIVNLARIASVEPITNGDQMVRLTNGARLRVSRSRRQSFLRAVGAR
jgi:two-component system LytT family response regulator